VDNAATGSNTGTSWNNAWESFGVIQWGSIQPGDTIYISGGTAGKTYNQQLNVGASGQSKANPIYIKPGSASTSPSGHRGQVRIDAQGSRQYCIYMGNHDFINIDGNDGNGNRNIYCDSPTWTGVRALDADGIVVRYLHIYNVGNGVYNANANFVWLHSPDNHCEVSYNYMDTTSRHGVRCGITSPPTGWNDMNIEIDHNTITNINEDGISGEGGILLHHNIIGPFISSPGRSGVYSDGIQHYCGWTKIYNNIFYDNTDYNNDGGNAFVFSEQGAGGCSYFGHLWIYNNWMSTGGWLYDNQRWVSISIQASVEQDINHLEDIIVANNIVTDIGARPIYFGNDQSEEISLIDWEIKNNIIVNVGNPASGLMLIHEFNDATSSIVVENNVFYDSDGFRVVYDGTTYTSLVTFEAGESDASGNTDEQPIFISYTPGNSILNDVRLSASDTAAIDFGQDLSAYFTYDLNDVTRPQGSAWDIGAYEYIV
jgi:hypothetical protein